MVRLRGLVVWAVLLGACSSGGRSLTTDPSSAEASAVPPSTVTAPAPSTSTPLTAFPSPAAAAAALIAAWQRGDRIDAGRVATPAAVDALFAHPFVPVEERGCQEPVGGRSNCVFRVGAALLTVVLRDEQGWRVGGVEVT